MPRATTDPTPRQRGGKAYTVTLKSGGTVTVTINVHPFELDNGDREFVFQLVDQVTKYQKPGSRNSRADTPEQAETGQPEHTGV